MLGYGIINNVVVECRISQAWRVLSERGGNPTALGLIRPRTVNTTSILAQVACYPSKELVLGFPGDLVERKEVP
jgi:hypothetical protein